MEDTLTPAATAASIYLHPYIKLRQPKLYHSILTGIVGQANLHEISPVINLFTVYFCVIIPLLIRLYFTLVSKRRGCYPKMEIGAYNFLKN